jgi:hypothetical protein
MRAISAQPRELNWQPLAVLAGLGVCTAIGFGAVQWPWIVSGALFGLVMIVVVLFEPLALVGIMLAIGPVDLSFMTGGFKSLFTGAGGLDMNGIRLLGLTFGFAVLALSDRRMQRVMVSKQGRWYLLFLIWAAASLATTLSTVEGARLLLKIAYPFLTFLVVSATVEKPEELDRLMACALVSGAVIALAVNPLFVVGGAYTVDPDGYRRVRGLGAHENPFSFYLLAILLISFTRFLVRSQWRYLGLCALAAFWIVLTNTRITVLGMFAGIGVMTLYAALAARNYRVVVSGLVLALVAGFVLVPRVLTRSLGYVPAPRELVALVRAPGKLYESINWQGREVLWPIVYHEFRKDPVTGLGMGSSTVVVRQNFPSYAAQVVHNEYLRIATDTGLVGVGLYALAVLSWLVAMLRCGWRAPPRVREFAIPALGLIVAWAFIAITDNAFDYYSMFTQYVGFLCGGALAAARLADAAPAAETVTA